MQDIDLDEKWRLKRNLFIMHAFEYLGNSSVNGICYFCGPSVLGPFTFQKKKKKLLRFSGENFKFRNVASACRFLKVKRLFVLREEKRIE